VVLPPAVVERSIFVETGRAELLEGTRCGGLVSNFGRTLLDDVLGLRHELKFDPMIRLFLLDDSRIPRL
jgi:hypothetical protein